MIVLGHHCVYTMITKIIFIILHMKRVLGHKIFMYEDISLQMVFFYEYQPMVTLKR